MRKCLKDIQDGTYAKNFIMEGAMGYPSMTARRRNMAEHQIEQIGGELRGMMPWIAANKIIDKDKN
jgi:ketol-acid reductoisomerase